jgi:hypothetical protein
MNLNKINAKNKYMDLHDKFYIPFIRNLRKKDKILSFE